MLELIQIKTISVEKLLDMQTSGQYFIIIEVLSAVKDLTEENLTKKGISKEDIIVVYCTTYSCPASTDAAKRLLEMGYENAYDFKAGKQGWDSAGFDLEVVWDFDDPKLEERWNYSGMFGRKKVVKAVA
jgi:rhodanese-related sulfurtransferase